jgi:hypothetical protein
MADDESDWMPYAAVITHVEATQHCHRERAVRLVREAIDGLRVKSRTVGDSPYYVESLLPGGVEIFFSSYGVGIEVWRGDVLREWPEHSDRLSAQPASKAGRMRRRPIEEGVVQAILDLWPNGIPENQKAKERNRRIIARLKENGASVPTGEAKAIQRALSKCRLIWTSQSDHPSNGR